MREIEVRRKEGGMYEREGGRSLKGEMKEVREGGRK